MNDNRRRTLMEFPCAQFVGAIRHHTHFVEDPAATARLEGFCRFIRERGIAAYLDAEYPAGGGKAFIVNDVGGTLCLVDGNAHLVALVACEPGLTLSRLAEAAGRSDFIRLWEGGWEDGSGQQAAYDVYIPVDTDTARIPEARVDTDWFKQPPAPTKVIPANIPFDSGLFAERDRGRLVGETADWLRERL